MDVPGESAFTRESSLHPPKMDAMARTTRELIAFFFMPPSIEYDIGWGVFSAMIVETNGLLLWCDYPRVDIGTTVSAEPNKPEICGFG